MSKRKPKMITFAQATQYAAIDSSDYWQTVRQLSGLSKPESAAQWAILMQRAGFSDSLIERTLTTLGFNGFEESGELPKGYIVSKSDSTPIFSARLLDGLERYNETRNKDTANAPQIEPDAKAENSGRGEAKRTAEFRFHCHTTPGNHEHRAKLWLKDHPDDRRTLKQVKRASERFPIVKP